MAAARRILFGILTVVYATMPETESSAANLSDRKMAMAPGVLHQSPYSSTVSTCRGRPCSAVNCAMACLGKKNDCTVFSHNPSLGTCILSRRPDDDAQNHESINPGWNTYHKVCPIHKGYRLFSGHQPSLCLRLDTRIVLQAKAKAFCRQEGADLVRIKSVDVYNIVKGLLQDEKYTGFVYTGAEDTQVEGQFHWNDGTALARGTDVWDSASEGYNSNEDCTTISSTTKLLDTTCAYYAKAFVCQYDV